MFIRNQGSLVRKLIRWIIPIGWTEFDNAYYVTYDNAYTGDLCAFNSQGDLTYDVVATSVRGYHLIDLYPGIYKQKVLDIDMTLIQQLTYSTDHPG
ncbi:hypothetical protein ACQKM9_03180 [Viridibacillus sp. NPDC093762]|uniref:hypothetical protein n=1 Tax=Viridibacillus sp. NPDC093762 TaxID=3390720 RepID=UPI003D07BC31